MKKSVILTIVVVYVLAIVAVGLLGIKLAVYDEIIYVDSIRLVDSEEGAYKVRRDYDMGTGEKGDLISIKYKPGLSFQLYYEVLPQDSTNKNVTFAFDYGEGDKNKDKIEVDASGRVTVKANETFLLPGYLIAQDGSKVRSKRIWIWVSKS